MNHEDLPRIVNLQIHFCDFVPNPEPRFPARNSGFKESTKYLLLGLKFFNWSGEPPVLFKITRNV